MNMENTKVPNGWELKRLGEIISRSQYGTSCNPTIEGNIPILRMNNINGGKILIKSLKYVNLPYDEIEKIKLKKGDILFNRTNSYDLVGKAAIFNNDRDFVFASYLVRFQIKRNKAYPEYINYFMNMDSAQLQLKSFATMGVSQANINQTTVKNHFLIPLPPLLEQKKIVEILSTWDLAIERTERLVERKKEFFNQIIDSLFNKNCSSWQKSTLSQIAKITMGQSPSSKYYNSEQKGLPLIQGNADIINRKTSPKLWTESITKSCEFGDIVMTVRAPAGVIAQSSHNACLGRGVCAIKATEIEHNFLYYTLLNYEKQCTKLEQGSTFKSINSKEIKQLVIKYPKGKENQNKIASLLSALDNEIRFLEQELIKLKQQKKGLLQKLLSGEVRVKP